VNRSVRSEDWNSNVALKDLDFHRRIVLGPVLKSMLLEQAEIDSKVRLVNTITIYRNHVLNSVSHSGWKA
jgi:hypothetical protein